jgi:hypothetical protein
MAASIDNTLFWQIYNALRDAEGVLWECDGAVNPENDSLNQSISELNKDIAIVLDKLQPIIINLKDECLDSN